MRRKLSLLRKAVGISLFLVAGALLIIVVFSAAILGYDTYRYKIFHGSEHVPDLAHFVDHYGDPERMSLVRVGSEQYYELIAPKGDYKVLASGPPIFLFDHEGKLWDYTPDSGDANFVNGNFQVGSVKLVQEIENPAEKIARITGKN